MNSVMSFRHREKREKREKNSSLFGLTTIYKMSFQAFMLEQGVLSVTIGTIIGFGTTNIASQIRKYVFTPLIDYYMKPTGKSTLLRTFPSWFRIPLIEVIASLLEFILLVAVVILVYTHFIMPFFSKEFRQQAKEEQKLQDWRTSIQENVDKLASEPLPYLTFSR